MSQRQTNIFLSGLTVCLVLYLSDQPPGWTDTAHPPAELEHLLPHLRSTLKMPLSRDIVLQWQEEGGEPRYFPESRRILFCGDFVRQLEELLARNRSWLAESERLDVRDRFLRFSLLHEVAHVLIGDRNSPPGEDEESAADGLAVWLALKGLTDGEAVVAGAVELFSLPGLTPVSTHSSPVERASRLACLLQGFQGSSTICRPAFQELDRLWRGLAASEVQE
ncbi:MAG: hypothetical protein HQL56_03355 [Magnetococcales bacterium]|nr:hypothetical protein [Magnetococcales bacterium]